MSEDGKAGVEIREANKKGLSIIDKPLEKNHNTQAANATNASRWDNGSLLSTIDKSDKDASHNTQAAIAKDLGWSTGKTAYGRKRGFYLLPYLLH